MSEISRQDQELLEQLKKKIEEVSSLPVPEKWSQKDYDFLVYFIEEKSGVRISLSTLKRIWKNENNRLPHIATLDALSQVAFEKKWLSLKADVVPNRNAFSEKKLNSKLLWPILGGILVLVVLFSSYTYLRNTPVQDILNTENVSFSAQATVANVVPNSIVFDYDVSDIQADKFYIQQSWDKRRSVEIYKENKTQTDIYYEPGLFKAKLIADSTIIAEIPVHIKTKDWFLQAVQENVKVPFDKSQWLSNGTLGVSDSGELAENIDLEKTLQMLFCNSRNFGTDGDNFSYSSSVKMDTLTSVPCPSISIVVKGDNNYFMMQVLKKGCESEAFLKISEKRISGKTNDLTILGTNVYEWQNLEITVTNKVLTMKRNGTILYQDSYQDTIGTIKEITYIFNGIGTIDNVVLKDANGSITYADDFD